MDIDDVIENMSHNEMENNEIENLDELINNLAQREKESQVQQERRGEKDKEQKRQEARELERLELVDDFIRNFFIKHKMQKSLEIFQQEWYELVQKGKINVGKLEQVPDVYIKNEKLEEQIEYLKQELDRLKITAEKAKATYDKLRKERDFHKMHHQRVQQEKRKLNKDIEKLKAMHKLYETKYQELLGKYEAAMKEKTLVKLERDRLFTKNEGLLKNV